ncbi:hypothetical protein ES703_72369 [subsurface metagenome]
MSEEATASIPRIDFDYYTRVRRCGLPPSQVRHRWVELHKKADGGVGDNILNSLIGIVIATVVTVSVIRSLVGVSELWITSPSGKTTKKVSFYTALRIIRKRGWHLTDVVPRGDAEKMTRFGALKIALLGDKGNERF